MPHTLDLIALAVEFTEHGFVRIPEAFSPEDASAMQDVTWRELEQAHGIRRDSRETWTIERPVQLQTIKADPVFSPLSAEPVITAIDHLLGQGNWDIPKQWGGFHLAFPNSQQQAAIPSGAWHADFHYTYDPQPLFGLVVFSFFDDVRPGGGGTIALARSHKFVQAHVEEMPEEDRKNYAQTRKRIAASDAWLSELMDGNTDKSSESEKFAVGQTHTSGGVSLEIVEFTANAGDMILMHPWLLHTASANRTDQPRMMRAKTIYRRSS